MIDNTRYGVDTTFILDRDQAISLMVGNVAKWGNSLAVRIPQHLAKEIGLIDGGEVEIIATDGNLTIKPRRQKQYSLEELISGITPENCHAEIDTGLSRGEEIW